MYTVLSDVLLKFELFCFKFACRLWFINRYTQYSKLSKTSLLSPTDNRSAQDVDRSYARGDLQLLGLCHAGADHELDGLDGRWGEQSRNGCLGIIVHRLREDVDEIVLHLVQYGGGVVRRIT